MSPDQRRMWTWAGAGLAVVAVGWGVLLWRGSARNDLAANADELYNGKEGYLKLYHPDKPGFAVAQAQDELRRTAASQVEELHATEGALAPPMPEAYLKSDLSDANSQVQTDLEVMRQLSARTNILIPTTLPFQGGLDAEAKARARQLAQLRLVRLAIESALQAGVARVAAVAPGESYASPDLAYAVFTCSLDVDAGWEATGRMIATLAAADGRGLGLRSLEVTASPAATVANQPQPLQKVRLVATLTAPNRETWGLAPGLAPTAAPGTTAAPAGGGGVRRLGNARP